METLQTFNFLPLASVSVICFLFGQLLKNFGIDSKKIAPLVGLVGLILGIIGFYIGIPMLEGTNLYDAASIGIVSGFSSSGLYSVLNSTVKNEKKEAKINNKKNNDDIDNGTITIVE